MQRRMIFLFLLVFFQPLFSQGSYSEHFSDQGLRIDYFHSGTAGKDLLALDKIYADSLWAGRRSRLLDTLEMGEYLLKVSDDSSGELLYSQGFSTLFQEWQTTDEAANGGWQTMHETVRIPFPRRPVQLTFLKRDEDNRLTKVFFQLKIDPRSYLIIREPRGRGVQVTTLQRSGDPREKIDLGLVAEGYSAAEAGKFLSDARRLLDSLFSVSPFRENRQRFNVYALFAASRQSGVDDPRKGTYHNSAVSASFNTFDSQRYLMTTDNRSLQDIASAAPVEALYILANTAEYGGGAIYNFYAMTAVDNVWSPYVFVHEFGHSFAALADEYYTSQVAYTNMGPQQEPWQPNVTAATDRAALKWGDLVRADTPVPTPWDKEKFDEMEKDFSAERNRWRSENVSAAEQVRIEVPYRRKVQQFLNSRRYSGKVGAFEGARYSSQGLYRPAANCIMFSKWLGEFDPVCRRTIEKVIGFLAD